MYNVYIHVFLCHFSIDSHLDCRYQFHVQGLTWMEAYNVCKDKNMTLLYLNNLNESLTIQSLQSQVNWMINSSM